MATAPGGPAAPRKRLVLLLAGAAGCLDAVGYLMLGLFTANMTGNTILLGLSVGRQAWADALHNLAALGAFVCGAGVGTAATRGVRRISPGLGLETLVLAAALAVWLGFGSPRGRLGGAVAYWLIALLSAAMGIQSAAVRRVGEQRIATTYVTGTLTSLATDAAGDLLNRRGPRRAANRMVGRTPSRANDAGGPAAQRSARAGPLLLGLWAVYLFGALVGGFGESHWSLWAAAAPLVVLVAVMASDLAHRPKEGVAR
jgi:uncharacterized membrane protein YoaK (UPF0700 family)